MTKRELVSKSVYEERRECPPVESFIWGAVIKDWGYFGGVRKLSTSELYELRALIEAQLRTANE